MTGVGWNRPSGSGGTDRAVRLGLHFDEGCPMRLLYGMNPHQTEAQAVAVGARMPVRVVNGVPSYVNLLDALNAWQLVRELDAVFDLPAAASFKHVSPAGAAIAVPLDDAAAVAYEADRSMLTALATAYVRARQTDPKSSYGDLAALSRPVDVSTARLLESVVSDGVVAPGYQPDALRVLRGKKRGDYLILQIDADFQPPEREVREVFGVRLVTRRDSRVLCFADLDHVVCGQLTAEDRRDLLVGMVTARYTQSNSVVCTRDGQTIGVGAGQQSRVDCVALAGAKAAVWWLRRHPDLSGLDFAESITKAERTYWRSRLLDGDLAPSEQTTLDSVLRTPAQPIDAAQRRAWLATLSDVRMVSDGLIPFPDTVEHAARHGVGAIAEPGGAVRGDDVTQACQRHGITLVHTGVRLFHH